MLTQLEERIESRDALIGIIGLGYVGLPLLSTFHRAGFRVIGFDIDPAKIAALREGRNYLPHLGESLVRDLLSENRFEQMASVCADGMVIVDSDGRILFTNGRAQQLLDFSVA